MTLFRENLVDILIQENVEGDSKYGSKKEHKTEKANNYIILRLLYMEVIDTSRNKVTYTSQDFFLIQNCYSHFILILENQHAIVNING